MKVFKPYIYCYTTPTVPEHDGWCKIGYTANEDPEECVENQGKRISVPTKFRWAKEAHFDDNEGRAFTDHDFHKYLTLLGIERKEDPNYRGNRKPEWFKIDPEKAKQYLNDFKDKVEVEKVLNRDYTLREEQEKAVNLTIDIMSKEGGRKEVLLNAKPRFGKTLTVYHYCKREQLKNILIVTNRPVIVTSWYSDYVKFLDTDKYKFVSNCSEVKTREYNMTREEWDRVKDKDQYNLIEFISLQDLKGSKWFAKNGIDKLKEVADRKWDILVIDESHEGVDTFKTEVAFNQIKRERTIYLSGTPFKQVASDKFEKDSIFNWTYADEQEKKANWDYDLDEVNPYEELPQLNLYTYKLNEMFGKTDLESDTSKYFNLNEFFATNNRRFINNDDVDIFLNTLATDPKFKLARSINHSLWLLDRVDSAKALAEKLRNHILFKDYEVVVAAGDGKINADDDYDKSYNRVIKAIKHHSKTITLSVGQLTTGVTIPEWSGVFMLCNLSSPSLYIQSTFRCQNPCTISNGDGSFSQKDIAYIFDFDPARTLDVMEQFANDLYSETAKGKGTEAQRLDNITKLIKYFPIYGESDNGNIVAYTAKDIVTIPNKIKAVEIVRHGFMSNLLFQNIGRLFNDSRALEILGNVKSQTQYKLNNMPKYDENGDAAVDDNRVENIVNSLDLTDEKETERDKEFVDNVVRKRTSEDFLNTINASYRDERKKAEQAQEQYKKESIESVKQIVTTELSKTPTIYNKSRVEKNIEEVVGARLEESSIQHLIKADKLKEDYDSKLNSATSKQEILVFTEEYHNSLNDLNLDFAMEQKLIKNNAAKEIFTETVKQSEKQQQEKDNRKAEQEFAYPKLKAFSRAIPSFLMAYGNENTTCKTLAKVINADMFKEMTGIDLNDYVYFIEKEYFNEAVFNSSIKEFLNLKDKLSNYFVDNEEDIFDYIPPQKTNQIFTPKKTVKMMVDFLEENDPGCFDDSEKTFIDPYMKSGLYITEIVTRLYNSEKIKKKYPDDKERLKHIFEKQVYGLAPTEILYKITTNFIFGFDKENKYSRKHFALLDANKYVGGKLEKKLDELFKD